MITRSFSGAMPSPLLRGFFAPVVIAVIAAPGSLAGADVVEFALTLDGSQEVPAVDTPATGSGTATLNTETNLFSWNITFSGLKGNQTAAHFHGAAPICVEAGVQIALVRWASCCATCSSFRRSCRTTRCPSRCRPLV